MATHAVHVLHSVDHVLLLDNGRLVDAGSPGDVLDKSSHPLAAAYRAAGAPEPEPETDVEGENGAKKAAGKGFVSGGEDQWVSVKKSDGRGQLTAKEDRTSGAVVWDTYATYVRAAGGGWSAAGVLALFVLGQCVFLGGDLWLAGWADRNALARRPSGAGPAACDLVACTCGPYDLSSMRGRTFRLPLDSEGFGLMFRICEDIPTAELPYTCQPEVIGDA
jgi:hypothetical protein